MAIDTTPTAPVQTSQVTSPVVTGDNPQPIVTSPVVEPAAPPVLAADPAPVDPAASPVDDGNTAPKTTPKWAQDRINELTAKRYEAERATAAAAARATAAETRAAELLAQIAKPTDPNTPAPVVKPAESDAEIERRVSERAMQIAQQNRFNEACNTVAESGKQEFKNWDDIIKNLGLVGAIGQNVAPDFLETAIELKNPHKVLHYLGTNLDEAEKIVKSSPKKMALEMARVEAILNAPPPAPSLPPVSNAPAPVIPVGGNATSAAPDINDPNISSEQFYALRAKQIAERKNRYNRA